MMSTLIETAGFAIGLQYSHSLLGFKRLTALQTNRNRPYHNYIVYEALHSMFARLQTVGLRRWESGRQASRNLPHPNLVSASIGLTVAF